MMNNISEKLEEAKQRLRKPYINELAWNVHNALPDAKVLVDSHNIYLYLYGEQQADLKEWLYSFLETLPDIQHPNERVTFVLYVDDSMEKIIIINPSENDVRALEHAKEEPLRFSRGGDDSWYEPLPLNHEWYSNKKYFIPKEFDWVEGKKVFRDQ